MGRWIGEKEGALGTTGRRSPSQRSPRAFVYPLPSLQIAYTAKEYARAPRKREIGLCGGESYIHTNYEQGLFPPPPPSLKVLDQWIAFSFFEILIEDLEF